MGLWVIEKRVEKMKLTPLHPNQIVTLNDFPVHNEHILKIFFKITKDGYSNIIPPCPVVHKSLILPFFDKKLSFLFKTFEKTHPKAEFFLLDGSHKTTALSLTGNKIKVMIFENNKDIEEAKKLIDAGELFSLTFDDTIEINAKELGKHFKKKSGFQTVEEKTEKMVKAKVIPNYMIKYYKELR